jgi:radical SAM superfamily enzyme YgiQ (UPF0313 family)
MINMSLPSLRADKFSDELRETAGAVRRTGLTFAPEAGTQRLRDVINKNVTREEILDVCGDAFGGGWNAVKLYFMLGLPTETDEDVLAIADLAREALRLWRERAADKRRGVRITVSTSCFVPKPHTPFQWEPQIPAGEYARRVELLRGAMRSRSIVYNWHSPETGFIEAALARGDRRAGAVIERAWRDGARLDAWEEYFSYARWMEAFAQCGSNPEFYALRERPTDELLAWDHISAGVSKEYLLSERTASRRGVTSPDCRAACSGCGAAALVAPYECDTDSGSEAGKNGVVVG